MILDFSFFSFPAHKLWLLMVQEEQPVNVWNSQNKHFQAQYLKKKLNMVPRGGDLATYLNVFQHSTA